MSSISTSEPVNIELLLPPDDEPSPEVSILVPAMNEELTVGEFVDWCREGLAAAGVAGEVLIVDSSHDATPNIALEHGARVLRVPRRGLGHAYRDAIPFVRGKYVIMGDADCTYDFRELRAFLDALRAGNDFVMGSRFKGTIEAGSMPWHHRYLGTPVTTTMLNVLFRTHFSDIHCGMRAATLEALIAIDLRADGWEYASEMILKALHLKLRVTEVPIRFYKDRNGRISNVKRAGPLTSWKAGWDTLRVMFVNGADFFLFGPGLALALVGTLGTALLAAGPRDIGPLTLTLHAESMFVTTAVIGLFSLFMGVVARCIYDPTEHAAQQWQHRLAYNRVACISGMLSLSGLGIEIAFLASYIQHDYSVNQSMRSISHLAIAGLLLLAAGVIVFVCTLVVHALAQLRTNSASRSAPTSKDLLIAPGTE